MRLLNTRTLLETGTHNAYDVVPTGPRKAYRITGRVVCCTAKGRESLVQWKNRDTWEHGTFIVAGETAYVFDEGDSSHSSSTPPDLEPGDEVTIDYIPLGKQVQALVIRWGRKEFVTEASDSAVMLQSSDEAFFSSMVDVAVPRIAEKKACA